MGGDPLGAHWGVHPTLLDAHEGVLLALWRAVSHALLARRKSMSNNPEERIMQIPSLSFRYLKPNELITASRAFENLNILFDLVRTID